MPLCTPWRSVRTSTTTLVPPRSVVVSAGTSAVQFAASANTTTSARSGSRKASQEPGQGRRADLLLALDQHGDPDRERPGRRTQPAARPGAPRRPPCRRRRRARRAARPARPARTGRCPSPRARPAAGRRGARTAGPWGRPAGRPCGRAPRAGCPRRSPRRPRAGRPRGAARRLAAALAQTCGAASGSADTDGIRTSRSRSARTDGRTCRTASLRRTVMDRTLRPGLSPRTGAGRRRTAAPSPSPGAARGGGRSPCRRRSGWPASPAAARRPGAGRARRRARRTRPAAGPGPRSG